MDRQRLEEIMNDEEMKVNWTGDNAFKGLQIIAKYIDPETHTLICSAEHDVFYSVDLDKLLNGGITEEDAMVLRKLNWMIEDDYDCLACFV